MPVGRQPKKPIFRIREEQKGQVGGVIHGAREPEGQREEDRKGGRDQSWSQAQECCANMRKLGEEDQLGDTKEEQGRVRCSKSWWVGSNSGASN